jgi:hypothetical protein
MVFCTLDARAILVKDASITGRKIRLQGILTDKWKLDNIDLKINSSTHIDKKIKTGEHVEVRGTVGSNNEIIVERIKND